MGYTLKPTRWRETPPEYTLPMCPRWNTPFLISPFYLCVGRRFLRPIESQIAVYNRLADSFKRKGMLSRRQIKTQFVRNIAGWGGNGSFPPLPYFRFIRLNLIARRSVCLFRVIRILSF